MSGLLLLWLMLLLLLPLSSSSSLFLFLFLWLMLPATAGVVVVAGPLVWFFMRCQSSAPPPIAFVLGRQPTAAFVVAEYAMPV